MFTPPPSPKPVPGVTLSRQVQASSKPSPKHLLPPPAGPSSLPPSHMTHEDIKRRTGRRFRYAVILLPLILLAITGTARIISSGGPSSLGSLDFTRAWSKLLSTTPLDERPRRSILEKRQSPSSSASASSSSSPSSITSATTTSTVAQAAPTVPATPPTLPTPFPQSFDGIISQNFSSVSCLNFFTNMTTATSYRSCRPFSMLMQNSNDFISAQMNATLLNTLIWGTCNTVTTELDCIANMASFSTNLKSQCPQELKENNAMAVDTLEALDAYGLMRDAACLTDPTTNTYCYVNAARDTNPTNLFYYSLPLGLAVPNNSDPQCNACLKNLMGLYGTANTGATKLPGLQATYGSAAELALGKCGAGYAVGNDAIGLGRGGDVGLFVLSVVLGGWTLLGSNIW